MPSNRLPEPIHSAARRIPEQGRIRLGVKVPTKSGKERPASIKTLRFTSADENAIAAIAALYGGQAKAWKNNRVDEWEVITTATEVPILLPPDPLGGTPVYELWDKGGLSRRCDGEEAVVPVRTADGVDMAIRPCLCTAAGAMACDPKVRLSVILKDIPFGGTWRLESKGWNVFHELPGMVEIIERLQSSGLVKAYLGVKAESKVIAGQTQDWVEPYLRLDDSPQAITEGAARFGALGTAPAAEQPALPAGHDDDPCPCGVAHTRAEHGYDPDDEIADAELVDETPPASGYSADEAEKIAAYLDSLPAAQADAIRKKLTAGWVAQVTDDGQVKVVRG